MATADLPASLKSIKPYLERASDLKERDPVVSYHCGLYALQQAMELRSTIPKEDMRFVIGLMDKLEQEKAQLTDLEDAAVKVENFGQELFMRADDADRAGRSDLRTGKAFLAAATVLETCKQFGELPEDMSEKIKYAKVRFVEIAKATKEGRAPPPPRGTQPPEPTLPPEPVLNTPEDSVGQPDGDPGGFSSLPPPPLPPTQDLGAASGLPSYLGLPPAAPASLPQWGAPPQVPPPPPPPPPPAPTQPLVDSLPAMRQQTGGIVIPATPAGFKPPRAQLLEATRLCQTSINALQFQDSETAVHQLTQALILLTQPQALHEAPQVPE